MSHLFAHLLNTANPRAALLLCLECLICGIASTALLVFVPRQSLAGFARPVLLGAVMPCGVWVTFHTGLEMAFPRLGLAISFRSALPALAVCAASAFLTGLIQARGRRSARNAMLCGSILAAGMACMIFTCMAALLRPASLAYNLEAVICVEVLSALLSSFGIWESASIDRPRAGVVTAGLFGCALLVVNAGSLGAILPLDEWFSAMGEKDSLAFWPIAIIVITETVAILCLTMLGYVLDMKTAARDRVEAARLREMAESSFEAIAIHRDGIVVDANQRLAQFLECAADELRGMALIDCAILEHRPVLLAQWQSSAAQTMRTGVTIDIVGAAGTRRPVEVLSRQITYLGEPAQVVAFRDISEQRDAEERIHFLAHHDTLTQLPNRLRLNEELDEAVGLSSRTGETLAVLCLDLDGFKTVNDTFGHPTGDLLLRQVAARLEDNMRNGDVVARVGGDEFVVLQRSGIQPACAAAVAARLVECLSQPFMLDGQTVLIGTSIGVAMHPKDGNTAALLLRNADVAMYRSKANGRGQFSVFEVGMDLAIQERRELERELRLALARSELSLSFQPLFGSNEQIVGFEALVRWNHAERGNISPVEFIPLAEDTGLIVPLGEWVLRTACREAAGWNEDHRIAVNVSPAQFRRGRLPQVVTQILEETGLSAGRLELEITEGVLIDDPEQALATFGALRGLGVRLVLDDFGTGYSSLSYLHKFSFNKIKVDRSFIQRMATDTGSRAIVNAIIAMSRNLDLEVTAEGVETDAQMSMLVGQGCDQFQGFLLSRPIPQVSVKSYLASKRHRKSTAGHDATITVEEPA